MICDLRQSFAIGIYTTLIFHKTQDTENVPLHQLSHIIAINLIKYSVTIFAMFLSLPDFDHAPTERGCAMVQVGTRPLKGHLTFPTPSPSYFFLLSLSLQVQASSRSSQLFLVHLHLILHAGLPITTMGAFAFRDTYPEAGDFLVDGSESEQLHFHVDSYPIPLLYAHIIWTARHSLRASR